MPERWVLRTAEEIIANHRCCRACGQRTLGEFIQSLTPYVGTRVLESMKEELAPPPNLMDVEL